MRHCVVGAGMQGAVAATCGHVIRDGCTADLAELAASLARRATLGGMRRSHVTNTLIITTSQSALYIDRLTAAHSRRFPRTIALPRPLGLLSVTANRYPVCQGTVQCEDVGLSDEVVTVTAAILVVAQQPPGDRLVGH